MSYHARPLVALLAAGWMAACATTPRVDLATEEQAIRELDRRFMQAFNAKDAATIADFYAADAQMMVPNGPPAAGRPAIRTMHEEFFRMNPSLSFTPNRIEVSSSGDMASDRGTYRLSFDSPQGRVDDEGSYVSVWRKIDGQWKITSDIVTSSKPMPPPPAPAMTVVVMESEQSEMRGSAGLTWEDFNVPGFKPGAKRTVIHGDPSGTGDYTLRVRFPDGYEVPPHWHQTAEHVTVLQGTFMFGMGERFDRGKLTNHTAGDFLYAPAKMPHFAVAKGETVVQLHGTGPFKINLVNPAP